ncbi:MAG: inorganic diphosphatase [Phycisphaerae bacterium]
MAKKHGKPLQTPLSELPLHHPQTRELLAVIETPQGSRSKLKFDEDLNVFTLHAILPAGASFPFDFGYIPRTLGPDGDPLDVLVLCESPIPAGFVIPIRLIGVMEAEQREQDGKKERNDRLIAVFNRSREHEKIKNIHDLSEHLIKEIEHFFISYNQIKGKKFKVRGCLGPKAAEGILEEAVKAYRKKK